MAASASSPHPAESAMWIQLLRTCISILSKVTPSSSPSRMQTSASPPPLAHHWIPFGSPSKPGVHLSPPRAGPPCRPRPPQI